MVRTTISATAADGVDTCGRRRGSRRSERGDTMLKTPLCDLFGIEVPVILAPMGTCTSAELAAAVSNAGGLGGIGTLFRATAAIKRDIDIVRTLTSRPFAINHIPQTLDAEAFRYTLEARPAVISFTLADPGANWCVRPTTSGRA